MEMEYQEHASGLGHCWMETDTSTARWSWRILEPAGEGKARNKPLEMDSETSGQREMDSDTY